MFQRNKFEVCFWIEFEEITFTDSKYHEKPFFLKWKRGKNKCGVSKPFLGRPKVKLNEQAHFISVFKGKSPFSEKLFEVSLLQVENLKEEFMIKFDLSKLFIEDQFVESKPFKLLSSSSFTTILFNVKSVPITSLCKLSPIEVPYDLNIESYKSEIENLKKKMQNLELKNDENIKLKEIQKEHENLLESLDESKKKQNLPEKKEKTIEDFSKFTNPVFLSQTMDPFIQEILNYFESTNTIFSIDYKLIGNDRINPSILLIVQKLSFYIKEYFDHDMKRSLWYKSHFWDFINSIFEYSSFQPCLDEDERKFVESVREIPMEYDIDDKLYLWICSALNYKLLKEWMKILFKYEKIVSKYFFEISTEKKIKFYESLEKLKELDFDIHPSIYRF